MYSGGSLVFRALSVSVLTWLRHTYIGPMDSRVYTLIIYDVVATRLRRSAGSCAAWWRALTSVILCHVAVCMGCGACAVWQQGHIDRVQAWCVIQSFLGSRVSGLCHHRGVCGCGAHSPVAVLCFVFVFHGGGEARMKRV